VGQGPQARLSSRERPLVPNRAARPGESEAQAAPAPPATAHSQAAPALLA